MKIEAGKKYLLEDGTITPPLLGGFETFLGKRIIAPVGVWIEHSGGPCPVPEGVKVDVRCLDREEIPCQDIGGPENDRVWRHTKTSGDIIAYRIPDPQELHPCCAAEEHLSSCGVNAGAGLSACAGCGAPEGDEHAQDCAVLARECARPEAAGLWKTKHGTPYYKSDQRLDYTRNDQYVCRCGALVVLGRVAAKGEQVCCSECIAEDAVKAKPESVEPAISDAAWQICNRHINTVRGILEQRYQQEGIVLRTRQEWEALRRYYDKCCEYADAATKAHARRVKATSDLALLRAELAEVRSQRDRLLEGIRELQAGRSICETCSKELDMSNDRLDQHLRGRRALLRFVDILDPRLGPR